MSNCNHIKKIHMWFIFSKLVKSYNFHKWNRNHFGPLFKIDLINENFVFPASLWKLIALLMMQLHLSLHQKWPNNTKNCGTFRKFMPKKYQSFDTKSMDFAQNGRNGWAGWAISKHMIRAGLTPTTRFSLKKRVCASLLLTKHWKVKRKGSLYKKMALILL